MASPLPALNLVAAPGRRRATLDLAREIERRGFAGISISSQYSNMSQCLGLAFATERIPFATAIAPIYAATAEEFANNAAYLHEVSGGRFQFGIGVAHAPALQRMGVTPGKPLADIRAFVAKITIAMTASARCRRSFSPHCASAWSRWRPRLPTAWSLPMPARSHMAASLAVLPAEKRDDPNFFIGNRIRTCICDDEAEAKAVLRRTVTNYALMPNYRNYWKEAGYVEEMTAIENAVADGRRRTRSANTCPTAGSPISRCSDLPRKSERASRRGVTQASARRCWCRFQPTAIRRPRSATCSPPSPTELAQKGYAHATRMLIAGRGYRHRSLGAARLCPGGGGVGLCPSGGARPRARRQSRRGP